METYSLVLFAEVHTNPFWDRLCKVLKETDSRVHGNIVDRFKHIAWVWHHNIQNPHENNHLYPTDGSS